ncbi:50S ribosomal protein L17 [Candidatus Falkowbacteria bacterium]|nr:50S ribosomal protein L17 [Candidatus Falkowbacteria bacterium]
MRHIKRIKTLSRKTGPRKALFQGLAISLISRGKIQTTLAKAKALRPKIERLVTEGRSKTLSTRRHLLEILNNEKAVNKLIAELEPKYAGRPGGYTRIIKMKERRGDCAKMAMIEFV